MIHYSRFFLQLRGDVQRKELPLLLSHPSLSPRSLLFQLLLCKGRKRERECSWALPTLPRENQMVSLTLTLTLGTHFLIANLFLKTLSIQLQDLTSLTVKKCFLFLPPVPHPEFHFVWSSRLFLIFSDAFLCNTGQASCPSLPAFLPPSIFLSSLSLFLPPSLSFLSLLLQLIFIKNLPCVMHCSRQGG